MPFSLFLGAPAPALVGYYHDLAGRYDEALVIVAALNVFSGLLIFLAPAPKRTVPGS
jgi:cyanate permease